MSRQAGWLAQCGLYGDCYALCLPLCLFGFRSPVNASVGRGCLLCRGCFVGRVCVFWGLAIGGMSIGAIASSYLARGTSRTPGYFVLLVPREPPLMFPLLFPLLVRRFGGFFAFLAFSAPFFSVLFPWAYQARLVLVVWGGALLEEGYPGWAA